MILIDGYEIDCAVSIEQSFNSEITEHPVESGADVADHVRPMPILVTIDGVVSNMPMEALRARRNQFELIDGEAFAKPADEALARLLLIRNRREPVTIEADGRIYKRMVLESLDVPRDASTGDALRFTATFKQIELVTNERATVRVSVPRAKSKVKRGNKVSEYVPPFDFAAEHGGV